MSVPAGWFRFGMAYSTDQLTVRLSAILVVSEVYSVQDGAANLRLYLTRGDQPMVIGFGARSAAETQRDELMAALTRLGQ